MRTFNSGKYELPDFTSIDWQKTKHNVGIFLSAYKTARERMGHKAYPKRAMDYSFITNESALVARNQELNDYEEYRDEFIRLTKLFIIGYTAIMHPYNPEMTERRRTIFMLKYLQGLSVIVIGERINYQKNIITDESKLAISQFAHPLSLIELKKPTLAQLV